MKLEGPPLGWQARQLAVSDGNTEIWIVADGRDAIDWAPSGSRCKRVL